MYSRENLYIFSNEIRHPFVPSYEKTIKIKGKKYLSAVEYLDSKRTDNMKEILKNLVEFYSYKLLKDKEFRNLLQEIHEGMIVFLSNTALGCAITIEAQQVSIIGSNILGKVLTCMRNILIGKANTPDLYALTFREVNVPQIPLLPISRDYRGGTVMLNLTTLIYLLQKYPNASTIISDTTDNAMFGIWWLCIGNERHLLVPNDFQEKFQNILNNPAKRFIIIPLVLKNMYLCNVPRTTDDHSNVLLYDKETGILERFEPHGGKVDMEQNWFQTQELDQKLADFFRDITTEYIPPSVSCPLIGPQAREVLENVLPGVGFCTVWSYWYIDLRLSNPDIDRILLQNLAISRIQIEAGFLTRYIYSFAIHIRNFEQTITESLPAGYTEDDEAKSLLDIIKNIN